MSIGFRADLKDSRMSSEVACPINAEFKYFTAILLLFLSQYVDTKSICPILETSNEAITSHIFLSNIRAPDENMALIHCISSMIFSNYSMISTCKFHCPET